MTTSATDCLDLEATIQRLAQQCQVPSQSVANAISLFQQGNTLPFIARYRKEATGNLNETQLREIEDGLQAATELAQRKTTILQTLEQQGELTTDLKRQILECHQRQMLEDLYLPFRPKRKTRATVARQQGLQPLADLLLAQESLPDHPGTLLRSYLDPDLGLTTVDQVLQGACDIVAETWSEDVETRRWLKERSDHGQVVSRRKRGKTDPDNTYQIYHDRTESVRRIPSHRFLAMMRGQKDGILNVRLELEDDQVLPRLKRRLLRRTEFAFHKQLEETVVDCYRRLLLPAIQSQVFEELKERSDSQAIRVFVDNLHQLLMAPPAGPQPTLGLDPGYRTGCKVAAVDGTGKFLAQATIFPTAPKNDQEGATQKLLAMIAKYGIRLIAIGNGTASRETDAFVTQMIEDHQLSVTKAVVSESGASIYSASPVAVEEYPDLDVTIRGAISIAHRLQDPLAELVKLDPKSIGVGQYQHDVHQPSLKRSLEREVASCVNRVGVNLNQASAALLSQVAGIGPQLAKSIVAFRDQHGPFQNRQQLLKVAKLGRKAFQQAAGFLRVPGSDQPLDDSAVHPESYYVVEALAQRLDCATADLIGNRNLDDQVDPEQLVDQKTGLWTIRDILQELKKPGRDPRQQFRAVQFDQDVKELSDLKKGLVLEGVVTNVTQFGAFVDIGVHQDGLIHVSEMADHYVEDPAREVAVGEVVRVKVLDIDVERKRISLSRKAMSTPPA